MGIESITAFLSYTQDVLRSVTQIFDKSSNKSLGERMTSAGQSLFYNVSSTDMARISASNTGNLSAYIAKFAAGGNSAQALANTIREASILEYLYNPWGGMGNFAASGYMGGMPYIGSFRTYGNPMLMGCPFGGRMMCMF